MPHPPSNSDPTRSSRWPHRLAVALVCVTFALIGVGGLVTTSDAGMAVPDWPSTYGYNMFLYPWQTWVLGPWDLLMEHGHRLLGAFAGMVTIALVVATFLGERRWWVRLCSVAALILVIAQGSLGGLRVLLDDRTLAMIHACVGPVFFSFTVALAVFTSRFWKESATKDRSAEAVRLSRIALLTTAVAFMQLIVGANLRHIEATTSHSVFRVILMAHLLLAAVLFGHGVALVWTARVLRGEHYAALRRPAYALALLILLQVAAGGATWVVNYSWPAWLELTPSLAGYTITAKSWLQSSIVTGHVVTGSLILAVAVQLTVRSLRRARFPRVRSSAHLSSLQELLA